MEIFLKEYTFALYICIPLHAPTDCPALFGCREDVLEGPDSAEHGVKRKPVQLRGPTGLMQTGARCRFY